MSPEDLGPIVEAWPRPAAPEGIRAYLEEARRQLVFGAYAYANFRTSAVSALQGMEAALSGMTGKGSFKDAIDAAHEAGLLDDRQAKVCHESRRFRNRLIHKSEPIALSPGAAAQLVEGIHHLLCELYGLEKPAR